MKNLYILLLLFIPSCSPLLAVEANPNQLTMPTDLSMQVSFDEIFRQLAEQLAPTITIMLSLYGAVWAIDLMFGSCKKVSEADRQSDKINKKRDKDLLDAQSNWANTVAQWEREQAEKEENEYYVENPIEFEFDDRDPDELALEGHRGNDKTWFGFGSYYKDPDEWEKL